MLKLRYFLQYIPLYLTYRFCRLLGFSKTSEFGGFIGRTLGYAFVKLKGVADNNIQRVYPKATPLERNNLIKKACDNMGRTFFEYFVLDIAHQDPKFKFTEINFEQIKPLADNKTPIMIVSAHLGNWEIGAKFFVGLGYSLVPIYRPINNPFVDALILRCRGILLNKQIAKGKSSGIEAVRALKNGNNMVVLADQKYNQGLDIPFFGTPAKTADGFVKLARAARAKIVPVVITRHNKTEFVVRFSTNIIDPKELTDTQVLTLCNGHIEDWVKTYPDQWFWFHRRWDKKLYKS